jgi:hypothetical protein
MQHPLCATCQFRSVCAKLAAYHRKQLVEVVGEHGIHRPARKRDISPADQRPPSINGKEISPNTRQFLKELSDVGYDRKELNDLMKVRGRGGTASRKYPWLLPAIERISAGCTVPEIRKVLNDHGVKGTMAASRASQFIKVLCFYDLVRVDEATQTYEPNTGEIA